MAAVAPSAQPSTEATPLLGSAKRPRYDKEEDAKQRNARFPYHPTARVTPLWRKICLSFFNGDRSLCEDDVWPLEPLFQGTRPAAHLSEMFPPSGHHVRLFRGVVAVHRRRLLWMTVLNVLSVGLASCRPLLLFQLISIGNADSGALLSSAAVFAPLVGIVLARFASTFVNCHCIVVMDRIQLHMYSSLFALIADRAVDNDTPKTHTQRLDEATKLLVNDLRNVNAFHMIVFNAWTGILKLAMSIAVLVYVVEVPWYTIIIAVGVYTAVLVVDAVVGDLLATPAESTLQSRQHMFRTCIKEIQTIKLNAWEDKMEAAILSARASEQTAASRLRLLTWISQLHIDESRMILAAVLFGLMTYQSQSSSVGSDLILTPARVFAALLLLSDCLHYGRYLRLAFDQVVVGVAASRRVEDFVLDDSLVQDSSTASIQRPTVSDASRADVLAELRGVCLTASDNSPASPTVLVNVNWALYHGELVIIHGESGVAKSMLLAAIRGDTSAVQILNGEFRGVSTNCRVAYCSSDPWLQTQSIRDNILFGTAFDAAKYWAVFDACGLLEDLDTFPSGDMTAVGPSSINLSSGQSARIALARACYADADLYLLDCPFANVDAVAQSEIFRKCIVELLMHKTVVIVTPNPDFIRSSFVDQHVEVKPLTVRVANRRSRSPSGTRQRDYQSRRLRNQHQILKKRFIDYRSLFIPPLPSGSARLVKRIQTKSGSLTKPIIIAAQNTPIVSQVTVREYLLGTSPSQYVHRLLATFLVILWGTLCVMRDRSVMQWAASVSSPQSAIPANGSGVMLYTCLVIACFALSLAVRWLITMSTTQSATRLFTTMTRAVLHAPMTLFYHTPIGDLIYGLGTDVSTVDDQLPQHLNELVLSIASFVGRILVLGWYLGPIGVIVLVVGSVSLARTLSLKLRVEISLMRQRVNTKLICSISEIMDSEAVVSAFGNAQTNHVFRSLDAANDMVKRVAYFATVFNSATVLHCEAVSTALALALLGILAYQPLLPAQFGLVLLYICMLQRDAVFAVGMGFGSTCVAFHSVERLREIGATASETDIDSDRTSHLSVDTWPLHGQITFANVSFAYVDRVTDSAISLALRDVSFSLRVGENVGVIGRTGSGKSSLAMALLRVHPLRSGRILLDGVDLRTVSLSQLRCSITVIPQSPTFYRCSVRDYLDPFHDFDDGRLWRELLTVELGSRVQSLEEELLDNGKNWSLGQRQLLCFARALLKPSRVVVLDEAFSCVDESCQEKTLRIVNERMAASTVLLITHRLDQILGFDRILVMASGRVVESGSPTELASDAKSLFYEFFESSQLAF